MAKRGRKPKLTPEVIERLQKALIAGNYMEHACEYAGISRSILYAWLAEAEKPDARKEYLELKDTITQAKAEAIVRNVQHINTAAQKNWQAAAWWLERTQKKEFGRNQQVELTGANGGAINVSVDAKTALLEYFASKDTPATDQE